MGYDERQQPSSSGALIAVIGVGLLLAILAIVVVAALSLFWVRTARVRAMVAQDRAVAELHRAGAEAQREVEEARANATPDPRLDFVLKLDREGHISVDDEEVGLEELRAKLVKLKEETSNVFSVHINADPECPAKHIITLLNVCEDVGDIDYRIVSSKDADMPADGINAGN